MTTTTTTDPTVGLPGTYQIYDAQDCVGTAPDLMNAEDYPAKSEIDCMLKCWQLGTFCVGFVRFTGGPREGNCRFRSGRMRDPDTAEDERDCYKRTAWTTTTSTTTTVADVVGKHEYGFG